jgi:hypothetical protein
MTQAARVNAAVLATLAWAPAPPLRPIMETTSLGYSTTLRWNPSRESDIAGYRVIYRETSSPVWQHHVDVKDTTVSLNVLKDDNLFGVAAIDRDGNMSLPSIPTVRGR